MSEENRQLPNGWATVRLGDFLPFAYGKGLTEDRRNSSGAIPVFGSSGCVGQHDSPLANHSTIIVGRKGSVGSVHRSDGPCWPIDTVFYSERSDAVDLVFFEHQLAFLQLGRLDKSTTIPSLSRDHLHDVVVRVPPNPEQKRIVDEIEKQFTRLDAGVAALKRVAANLKRYKAAVLKAAVEGRLTARWRAEHPNVEPASELLKRILKERRRRWEQSELAKMLAKGKPPTDDRWKKKYKEPIAPDLDALPPLPNNWLWATIDQLGEVVTGCTPSTANKEFYGGAIQFFRPTDLNAGYFVRSSAVTLTAKGADHARMLPANSVLVTCIGATIGKTGFARVPGTTNQQINAVALEPFLVIPEWLFWAVCSSWGQDQIKSNASATTLPILNRQKFCRIALPLPPLDEQRYAVGEVEARVSLMEEIVKAAMTSQARASRLRQSILKRAFEGKLVPQDPTDEPASVLLDRIRAEHAKTRGEATPQRSRRGRRRQRLKHVVE